MKALLDATGYSAGLGMLNERMPTPLALLANKPVVHHVVEFLVEHGVVDIRFFLNHLPERIEDALGSGERWGAHFEYRLARDPAHVYESMQAVCAVLDNQKVLIGRADELPLFDPRALEERITESSMEVVACPRDAVHGSSDGEKRWSGWAALLSRNMTPELPEKARAAIAQGGEAVVDAPLVLGTRSSRAILDSSKALVLGAFPGLAPPGSEVEKGVWLGRNVVTPPSCRITAPACVGADTRLGPDCVIGPGAVIGENCIIETGTVIEKSVVFPGSYVGEALEIRRTLVDRNLLLDADRGGDLLVTEAFLLGEVKPPDLGGVFRRFASRLTAVVLLIGSSPLLLLLFLVLKVAARGGPVLQRKECVRTPAESIPAAWRTFDRLRFGLADSGNRGPAAFEKSLVRTGLADLPQLVNIARGELAFVGLPPRSRSEMNALPSDWRQAALVTKSGVVTLMRAVHVADPSRDDCYVSDLYYAASANWKEDLKLLGRMAIICLRGKAESSGEAGSSGC